MCFRENLDLLYSTLTALTAEDLDASITSVFDKYEDEQALGDL